jgi:hypothetical protein
MDISQLKQHKTNHIQEKQGEQENTIDIVKLSILNSIKYDLGKKDCNIMADLLKDNVRAYDNFNCANIYTFNIIKENELIKVPNNIENAISKITNYDFKYPLISSLFEYIKLTKKGKFERKKLLYKLKIGKIICPQRLEYLFH